MADIKDLERFSDEILEIVQSLLLTENKEDLVLEIERIKKERELRKGKTLNDLFLVEQLNIDPYYIEILKQNGIYTQTDLINADLNRFSLPGTEARRQYEYAKKMFDFRPIEKLQEKKERSLTDSEVSKVIIKELKKK